MREVECIFAATFGHFSDQPASKQIAILERNRAIVRFPNYPETKANENFMSLLLNHQNN